VECGDSCVTPLNSLLAGRIPSKPSVKVVDKRALNCRSKALAYTIVAEKDNATVKIERNSLLIAVAKARVWADEGWHVVVSGDDGEPLDPAEFDRFLAA
jgi:hypothetical protein